MKLERSRAGPARALDIRTKGRFVEPLSASDPLAANLAQLRKLITI